MSELGSLSLLDQLIEDYKSPETFEVALPKGEVFVFKAIASHTELVEFKRQAIKFVKVCVSKNLPEAWKEFAPIAEDTATKVFTISELSIEPKLTQVDVLKLANNAPWIIEYFYAQIDLNRTLYTQRLGEEALAEGKVD